MRKNISDRGNHVFKGPEVSVCLAGLSTTEEASVAGVEGGRGGVLGDEGVEAMGQTL